MENKWHAALNLVPHRPPMLLVDEVRLVPPVDGDSAELFSGEGISIVKPDWPLLDNKGTLLGPAFFEIAAQTFAASAMLKMAEVGLDSEPRMGFLVAVKRFAIDGQAFVGDKLETAVRTVASLGEFTVLESKICKSGSQVAAGQLKIYAPTAQQVEAMLGVAGANKK